MPGYFSIDDPTVHKIIYSHGNTWTKGESYEAWHVGPNMSNLFSERDPGKHAVMRRKVASMYSMSSMVSYESYVDSCIELLQNQFSRVEGSGSDIDLAYWFRCYAFDVIFMITVLKISHALLFGHECIMLTSINIHYSSVIG